MIGSTCGILQPGMPTRSHSAGHRNAKSPRHTPIMTQHERGDVPAPRRSARCGRDRNRGYPVVLRRQGPLTLGAWFSMRRLLSLTAVLAAGVIAVLLLGTIDRLSQSHDRRASTTNSAATNTNETVSILEARRHMIEEIWP